MSEILRKPITTYDFPKGGEVLLLPWPLRSYQQFRSFCVIKKHKQPVSKYMCINKLYLEWLCEPHIQILNT